MLIDDETGGLTRRALHKQQLSTYMRLAGIRVGLLINFNVRILRHGIRRILLTDP